MNTKIIDEKRYKKTTKKEVLKQKEKLKKIIIEDRKTKRSSNSVNYKNINMYNNLGNKDYFIQNNSKKKYKNSKIKKYSNSIFSGILKITYAVCGIAIISYISRFVIKHGIGDGVYVNTTLENGEVVSFVQDYDFKIGMSKLDTTDYLKSRNVILNELVNLSNISLVKLNKDYSFDFVIASGIEKVNDKEYILDIDTKYGNVKKINEKINEAITTILSYGSSNRYYNSLSNISEVLALDNKRIKIILKKSDSYFPYYLDFPIFYDEYASYTISSDKENIVEFESSKYALSQIGSINFRGYDDNYSLIDDFKSGKIDMFTATSDSLINLIGKYDINMKKYRNGETIFILGNSSSKLFNKKEVRQALSMSLNKDEIVKKVNAKFSEVIDIPYIYSDLKYKYDTYGVANTLSANGWKKSGGVYTKNIDGENTLLELNLLVNQNDKTKLEIAELIKEMAGENGIKINVISKIDEELQDMISNKSYDIILADVNINQVPDISFLYEHINISDSMNKAIENVENSNFDELSKNITVLQDTVVEEVACIGILAKTSNIVYQKNISGFSNISYMNVFDELKNVGKIQNVDSNETK